MSLGWAHQLGPISVSLPSGAGTSNSWEQAGWATPSWSSAPGLLTYQAPGQWPLWGPKTLWLEAVTGPAVSRLQSGEGALSILSEPRGGEDGGRLGGQVCFALVGGHWKGTASGLLSPLNSVPGLMIFLPFFSLGHCDLLASGHLAARRQPLGPGDPGEAAPEERSGH